MKGREQEADDSLATNNSTQLSVLAFSTVPHGVRSRSSPANSGKSVQTFLTGSSQ